MRRSKTFERSGGGVRRAGEDDAADQAGAELPGDPVGPLPHAGRPVEDPHAGGDVGPGAPAGEPPDAAGRVAGREAVGSHAAGLGELPPKHLGPWGWGVIWG
jgi:hypothetical protein